MNEKYVHDNITVVKVSGDPFEIGYKHGSLCRDEIGEVIEMLYKSFDDAPSDLLPLYLDKSKELESNLTQDYVEELRGISEGSGTPYEKILLHNMATTIDESQRCLAFSHRNDDNTILTLRHLDHRRTSHFYRKMILFVIKPNTGHGFAAQLMPGTVDAETAMNEKGITISQNNIRIKQTTWNVTPITALARKLIQYSESIDDVDTFLDQETHYPARLIFCSTPTNASFFEMANAEKVRVDMGDERYLAISNHATHLKSKNVKEESAERLERVNDLLSSRENVNHTDMVAIGRDPILSRVGGKSNNWQSVLFSPKTLNFWVAESANPNPKIPACNNKYVGFNLRNLLYEEEAHVNPAILPPLE